jgi:hypothetical protein
VVKKDALLRRANIKKMTQICLHGIFFAKGGINLGIPELQIN